MAWVLVLLLAFSPCVIAREAAAEYDFLNIDLSTIDDRGCDLQAAGLVDRLKGADADQRLELTVGGQPLSVGLTHAQVAGMELSTALGSAVSVTTFGGLPASPAADGGILGNLVYGGRIDTRPLPGCDIGLAVRKDNGKDGLETAATDLRLTPDPSLTLSGSSTLTGNEWHGHRYTARLQRGAFDLAPVLEQVVVHDDPDRVAAQSHLYGFLTGSDATVRMAADLLST